MGTGSPSRVLVRGLGVERLLCGGPGGLRWSAEFCRRVQIDRNAFEQFRAQDFVPGLPPRREEPLSRRVSHRTRNISTRGACSFSTSRCSQELAANAERLFSAFCVCRVFSREFGEKHAAIGMLAALSEDSPQLSNRFVLSRNCANMSSCASNPATKWRFKTSRTSVCATMSPECGPNKSAGSHSCRFLTSPR